jgi:hypothetical protein
MAIDLLVSSTVWHHQEESYPRNEVLRMDSAYCFLLWTGMVRHRQLNARD